jgi:hypothetical protein
MRAEQILSEVNITLAADRLQDLQDKLAEQVNQLILYNFDQLVQLLYRVDVPEKKLKQLLHDHTDADAGQLISSLLIKRQLEKLKSRQQYKSPPPSNDEERW